MMPNLGAVYPKGDKFYAKILFSNAMAPVYYFRIDHRKPFVILMLKLDFLSNMRVVSNSDFQTEVDYRKIFGEPSDNFIPSVSASDERIIKHHEEMINGH